MSRQFYFIVNKKSQDSRNIYQYLINQLPKYTLAYKIFLTESVEQAYKLFENLKPKLKKQDIIVSVGGDGTLHYILNHLKQLEIENPISFLPGGSGNDFARSNDLPLDFESALNHLFKNSQVRNIDILCSEVNGQLFYAINSIGAGIDGDIIYSVHKSREASKKLYGNSIYIKSILLAFLNLKPFDMTLQLPDEENPLFFKNVQLMLCVNQAYFGGGIKIFPEADNQDGMIDILIAHNATFKDFVQIVWKVFRQQTFLTHPKISTFTVPELSYTIHADQYSQKDGESFKETHVPIHLSIGQHAFYY